MPSGARQTGRLETLGAWLRVWTPPRDVEVPPPPSPLRIAAAAAVVLVVAAIAAVAIGGGKEEGDAREAREQARIVERERARLRREQAPRRGRAPVRAYRDPAGRARLVAVLERAITADATARHRSGAFDARVLRTRCQPYHRPKVRHPPEPPRAAASAGYECLAVTGVVPRTERTERTVGGYPFWARVDLRRSRWVYCKVNPRPAEGSIGRELAFVPLPPECALGRDRRPGA